MHTKSASTLVNRAQFALAVDDPRKLAKAIKRLDKYLGILRVVEAETSKDVNTQFPMKLIAREIACPIWFHVPHFAAGYRHPPRIEMDWIGYCSESWSRSVKELWFKYREFDYRLRLSWQITERCRPFCIVLNFDSTTASQGSSHNGLTLAIQQPYGEPFCKAVSGFADAYCSFVRDFFEIQITPEMIPRCADQRLPSIAGGKTDSLGVHITEFANKVINSDGFVVRLEDYSEVQMLELMDRFARSVSNAIGPPSDLRFRFGLFGRDFQCERARIQASGICHCQTRWGKFDPSFDIFSSTHPDDEHIAVYPQMTLLRYDPDNSALPKILLLGVNIVKRRDGCYLELQSTRGRDWIEFAAHFLQCEVEFWEGNPAQRWSWYEPADPWSVSVYNPADHPICRPHIDPPDLRDPVAEKILFDTVDAELETSTA